MIGAMSPGPWTLRRSKPTGDKTEVGDIGIVAANGHVIGELWAMCPPAPAYRPDVLSNAQAVGALPELIDVLALANDFISGQLAPNRELLLELIFNAQLKAAGGSR